MNITVNVEIPVDVWIRTTGSDDSFEIITSWNAKLYSEEVNKKIWEYIDYNFDLIEEHVIKEYDLYPRYELKKIVKR
jgi:hypothetical protein